MFCTDRSRRRNTDAENDKPLEVTQQDTTDTQPNGYGRVEGEGHGFETQIVALIGLRSLKRRDNFELFTNRDDDGKFVDIVYTADGRWYFIQPMHADSLGQDKLTKGELVRVLQKCFRSYCDIKCGKGIRDIPADKSEFIIYTDRKLKPELSHLTRIQTTGYVFFKTRDNEIFKFISGKIEETDLYTLMENAVEGNQDIHGSSDREIISEFLSKVTLVASVECKWLLDNEIRNEIKERDANIKVPHETYIAELLYLNMRVDTWLKKGKETVTAEMFRIWLQEARTEACRAMVISLFVSCKKELVRTDITFTDSEISRLKAELSNMRSVHVRSDAFAICGKLLLKCLPESKCIFVTLKRLQSNTNKLLYAWLGGDWQWCVVFCDSEMLGNRVTDICPNMFSILKFVASNKYLIILTPFSIQQIQGFSPIDHKFKFEHLSKRSKKMVLRKKVDFQGHTVLVKSILHQHDIVETSLGADVISELMTKRTVQIGGTLHKNRYHYTPRVLEKEIWLQLDVLWNPDMYPDMFAVSGMGVKDLAAIVPAGEIVEYIVQQNIHPVDFGEKISSRFVVLSETVEEINFCEHCKKHGERTLHWVQFKNGNLLWKKTHGGPDKLLTYIDTERTRLDKMCVEKYMRWGTCEVSEKEIWDLGERTVLVVAEPGMGKSSTTTQVARRIKLAHPTSWVMRINWSDHCRKLQQINAETFNFNSLFEFLCSAAFPELAFTNTENILLKQALQKSGNVTVLMDGFDEISPIHAGKAAVILSELMKTQVRRVWVTSRPVEKERLEKELSVTAFSMKKLSNQSPSMLKSLHNKKTEEEIQPVLGKVQAGKGKKGVVMNVVGGKPHFVCPSFAECLVSRWLSKDFEFKTSVLENILFKPEYNFVRDKFDRILAKDCPLHCAVLEWDEGSFETLLEGCDISAVDKGGRTVMHIIATRHCSFLDIINRVFPREASLHNTDFVLQWTPLQYAINSERWFIVERLLESNVDRSGLDMIRQRAQDPDYIDPIIIQAALDGHLLLLEFLCSIGVNFHQASSRGFLSPLHAAIQGEQLPVIRLLIQHGADCNTRYSDGQTPLFYAVTKSTLDVVRLLVEKGGASVDIRDDHGRTVINWITSYRENSDFFCKEYKLEELNEIVKYLQETGYK